jgi:polygalacturonase
MSHLFDITDFGAVGDNKTKNTQAFRDAIDAASAAGGGTVVVPAGEFFTGAIHLKSNIHLHLVHGSKIRFSCDWRNEDDFPFVESRWAGTELWMYSPCVFGKDLENVSITGKGVFDGDPKEWWDYFFDELRGVEQEDEFPNSDRAKQLAELNKGRYEDTDCGGRGLGAMILRPPLMELNNCSNVRLDGFTNQNSPFWNTHLLYCENVTVHDVTFRNPNGSPNGDGLDLDSCRGVRVSNCFFDVNDDCLCLKSGMNDDGHRVGKPTEYVTITNCTMLRGHGGVVMGSDGAGGIRNVTVTNCVFSGTQRGIRLKSNRFRYSKFEDIRFDNIIMQDVMCPIVMNLYYTCGGNENNTHIIKDPGFIESIESTPRIRNIHISNVTARGKIAAAGIIVGLPEEPITGVTLDNVIIEGPPRDGACVPAMVFGLPEMNGDGIYGRNIRDLVVRNSTIGAAQGYAINISDIDGLELTGVRLGTGGDVPVVQLIDAKNVSIRNCRAGDGPAAFLATAGAECDAIELRDNRTGSRELTSTGDDVPEHAVITYN